MREWSSSRTDTRADAEMTKVHETINYQSIPLKGSPHEMMNTWAFNDWAMICDELGAYRRGKEPPCRVDLILAGRRLEEVEAAYLKRRHRKS